MGTYHLTPAEHYRQFLMGLRAEALLLMQLHPDDISLPIKLGEIDVVLSELPDDMIEAGHIIHDTARELSDWTDRETEETKKLEITFRWQAIMTILNQYFAHFPYMPTGVGSNYFGWGFILGGGMITHYYARPWQEDAPEFWLARLCDSTFHDPFVINSVPPHPDTPKCEDCITGLALTAALGSLRAAGIILDENNIQDWI
jgi:hypothetical protein